jgi:glucan biosynthesis protein C
MDARTIQRRSDLDWLRVMGILLVFIYHSSRFYNVEDWTVKNNIWYPLVEVWNSFSTTFMMPLMFVISGASLFYAMGKGGFGKFLKDKTLRLLIPLLVAVLTQISIQSYLYSNTHEEFSGNYFQFLPHYYHLDSINWLGGHLWYIWFLLLFSILLYPLFRWLKGAGRGFLTKLDSVIAKTGVLYILVFPFLVLYSLIDSDSPLMRSNGGYPYIMYLWYVVLGFLVTSDQRIQDRIRQLCWVSLIAGLLMSAGFAIIYNLTADKEMITASLVIAVTMRVFGGWLSVLGFMGLAMQYLNIRTPQLEYANEAVLPFYILHQTVLLAVGYFVLQWGLPEVIEWAVIMVISFAIIMAIYEFVVRRFNVMRFLFGMKALKRTEVGVTRPAQPMPGKA